MRRIITGLTAAALLATIASPADARRRHHRHHDDVDSGDVVAGAVVIGGIAAIASAIREDKRRKQDAAVDRCSGEAESRTGGRVAEIFHVARRKGYYTVEGALEGGEGPAADFTCTVRRGTIYSFETRAGEA
ncbi:MAG TPA: hypothetical protein VFQ67_03940 [Allosphingosinicella sp.]|jgi:hypothetical protein|nr:hypothetical protein [Allosphingosinicella sp.]